MTKFGWCLTGQHDKCPRVTTISERRTPCGCDCHDEPDFPGGNGEW